MTEQDRQIFIGQLEAELKLLNEFNIKFIRVIFIEGNHFDLNPLIVDRLNFHLKGFYVDELKNLQIQNGEIEKNDSGESKKEL